MARDATAAAAEAESNVVREVYLSFGVVITDRDARQAHEKAEYVRALGLLVLAFAFKRYIAMGEQGGWQLAVSAFLAEAWKEFKETWHG